MFSPLIRNKKKNPPSGIATERSARGQGRQKGVGRRLMVLKERVREEKPEWIKTGVPGFDELLEKGIPKGANILVAGGPGTGKTIFCLQTLYNAACVGNDCLYVTFEELPRELKRHMEKFGWNIEKVEQKGTLWDLVVSGGRRRGTLTIRKLDPFKIARSVEALLAKAKGQLRIEMGEIPELIPTTLSPYLIALDSISALESAFTGKPESYRIYIEQLFRLFKEVGATTFLITETDEVPTRYSRTGVEEFLADGVFVLYNIKMRDRRTRAIEILKLRGARHDSKIVPIHITDRGMTVFPGEHLYEIEE
jgi:circadian clock protein KaiC